MSVIYECRHCKHIIGELHESILDTSQLGWDILSHEEKREMIQYKSNGDIVIKSICESCNDLLEQHPEYHELDYFIQ